MILSVIGAVIIVLFSRSEEPVLDPEAIIGALSQLRFVIFASVGFVLACCLLFLDVHPVNEQGDTFGDRYMMIRVWLTAIFSGYSVLATKSLSSLLTVELYKIFTYWIFYVVFTVLIVTALLTLYYTNKALASFDSTRVLPAEFASFTFCAVFGSAMLYNDFDSATPTEIVMFFIGCIVIFAGVYLITSGDDKYAHLMTDRSSLGSSWAVQKESFHR
jgi:hypothetical protein